MSKGERENIKAYHLERDHIKEERVYHLLKGERYHLLKGERDLLGGETLKRRERERSLGERILK